MVRHCHLNTCPTGIATQDERLRGKFRGRVDGVIAYFSAIAREVRELLSGMGFRSLDEIIGRTDLLEFLPNEYFPASKRLRPEKFMEGFPEGSPRKCGTERNDNPAPSMNDRLLDDLLPQIERAEPVTREYRIRNVDRSVPLKLNYHISLRYRDTGLPKNTINLIFRGAAGQSFGAFNHRGISLTLIGEANDYAGKGMFGGRIVIKTAGPAAPEGNVIAGNTVLYGATGGEFYCGGMAGERFAVRNSGATAVVEGSGDHLCEYMTRGTVVVLGEVGSNIGAGMTGGEIYVFDAKGTARSRLNTTYVEWYILKEEDDRLALRSLLESHYGFTKSPVALEMLRDFGRTAAKFIKIVPVEG
jgi:glutamate synthase (NADPH/NADH) large chain